MTLQDIIDNSERIVSEDCYIVFIYKDTPKEKFMGYMIQK